MQSLLSTIHHSLCQSRSAFALRVFVSYDASGRRKESVVVDIEQPRPPPFLSTPRHTIRILSPAAPLHTTSTHTTHSTVPVALSTSTISTRTPFPSSSTHTALSTATTSTTLPSVAPASLPPVRPPAPPIPLPPSSLPLASLRAAPHCAATDSVPPSNLIGASSSLLSPLTRTVLADTLTLPSRGIDDAVDVEMGNGSDCHSGGSSSGQGSGSSSTTDSAGSSVDPVLTSEPITADEARRVKDRHRRKARKKQWRERKRERARLAVDESKEENEEGGDRFHALESVIAYERLPAALIADKGLKVEYARRLADIQQAGGYVSIGTYRKLQMLIDEDAAVLESRGRSWASEYAAVKHITVRIVVSDDDLPYDEQDYSGDDVMIDE